MKKQVIASYEAKFWKLHDRDYETGTALEDIIDDFGWGSRFFPEGDEEPEADEEDYKAVLDEYQSASTPAQSRKSLSHLVERLSNRVGMQDMIDYIATHLSTRDEVIDCLENMANDLGLEV